VVAARRALAIGEASLGPEHPNIAATLDNIGNMLAADGHHDEAMIQHRRALAIREKALGPTDPSISLSLMNIANAFEAKGELDAALEYNRRALSIAEAALGPDHHDVALALFNVGQTRVQRREFTEAIPDLERALRLSESGATPPNELADRRFLLAEALAGAGTDPVRARALAQQARDGYTTDVGTLALRQEIDAWLAARAAR
jgi:tetratricopeptide (TPR) repeat protein